MLVDIPNELIDGFKRLVTSDIATDNEDFEVYLARELWFKI